MKLNRASSSQNEGKTPIRIVTAAEKAIEVARDDILHEQGQRAPLPIPRRSPPAAST